MSKLQIEYIDGKIEEFQIDEASDQAGLFQWRGDAKQAQRYGYVAVRDGVAITLNGDAGPEITRIPLASIRKLREVK